MQPRSAAVVVAVAVAATFAIVSCTPSYDAATRDGLRQHVVAVAQASAAGDWDAAIQDLDVMAARLSDARRTGHVSDDRFNAILLAMELVRQDIDTAIVAEADAAERQRLIDEQARLEEQIAQLQNQRDQRVGDDPGDERKNGGQGKEGAGTKNGEKGSNGADKDE